MTTRQNCGRAGWLGESLLSTLLLASMLAACDGPRAAAGESQALRAQGPTSGVRFGTARCDQCLAAQCNPYRGSIQLLGECADRACEQTFACFQRSHCATDVDTVNQCYCGKGVSNDECLQDNFKARGPCADLAHKALGSHDPRTVLGLLYATDTSMGDGAALFQCGAELCAQECLLDPAIPSVGP